MTIDKQALRKAAEKADSGEWSYEEFNRMDLPGGAHININGRDAIYCLKKPVGGVEQSRAVTAFIAAFNPKVALALLDEVESAEHTAAVDHEAACSLVEENEELKRRITELESKNSNLRTIAHEQNELAIMANLDSINDAVEMDSLHKRIAETDQRNAELTAQVVPDDGRAEFEAWMLKKWGRERQEYDFAMGKFLHGENYADSYTRHMWKAWTESRAALLQSKYRDLSQPVDPQISEYEKIMLQAGWVMVPKEPTKSMRMAIHPLTEATCMNCGCKVVAECEDNIFMSWDDMLSAAPQPEGTNGK
ncbi:ead/Ea22-like family protein [Salmonella enterica]|nr:ead/Ea22-like family protein [Salmonella enterica]